MGDNATLDLSGSITFDTTTGTISISGEGSTNAAVNILSTFVNATEDDGDDATYDLSITDIATVTVYGDLNLSSIYIDQSSLTEEETKSTDLSGDITTETTIVGSDTVSVGDETGEGSSTVSATISTTDVSEISVADDTTFTSDTAFVVSSTSSDSSGDASTENSSSTEFSGTVSFGDATVVDEYGKETTVAAEKTAVQTDSSATIAGTVSATYDSEALADVLEADADADVSSYLTAIKTTDGTVNLDEGTTVSSEITVNGTTYTGVAITNEHTDGSGLTINVNGTATANGSIVANSPMTVTVDGFSVASQTPEYTEVGSSLVVAGGVITTNADTTTADVDTLTIQGVNLVLTTNSAGTMSSLVNVGEITTSDSYIVIAGSASMLAGSTYTIADSTTILNNYANWADINIALEDGDFSNLIKIGDDLYTYEDLMAALEDKSLEITDLANASLLVNVDSLTYFQNNAETANETELAVALDYITADGEVVGDTAYNAKVAFKVAAEANGLSSYIMNANSYIAEVDTMLLSNMNFANVNRARSILEKSAGIQLQDEDGSISLENEDGTISVVDADSVSLIKYSNVAQLQSINLLGSKSASNGVAGYDYWSVGSTANFDEILSENALVGVSIGGTYNKVEGDAGDNANSTTFLLNFYGVYAYEGFEAFANIGYAHFWNEGSKSGASADWDSDAFNALIGVSYKMQTGVEGLSISPVAMLNLVCLDADSASYSNDLRVDDQSYFSAKLMLGFEVEYAINAQFNVLARAMYSHECGDTSYDNTYSLGFVNGVNYIGSEAGADSAVMGLGLSYDFSETCTAYFDYNAYAYSNLITHSLNLSVALKF